MQTCVLIVLVSDFPAGCYNLCCNGSCYNQEMDHIFISVLNRHISVTAG
jgi:hypothetical protein